MIIVYDEAARDIVALASNYVDSHGKATFVFAEAMDYTFFPDGWHEDYVGASGILKDYANTPIGKLVTAINAELKAQAPKIGKAIDQNWVKPRYAAIKRYLDIESGLADAKKDAAKAKAKDTVSGKADKATDEDKAGKERAINAIAESAWRELSRVLGLLKAGKTVTPPELIRAIETAMNAAAA